MSHTRFASRAGVSCAAPGVSDTKVSDTDRELCWGIVCGALGCLTPWCQTPTASRAGVSRAAPGVSDTEVSDTNRCPRGLPAEEPGMLSLGVSDTAVSDNDRELCWGILRGALGCLTPWCQTPTAKICR